MLTLVALQIFAHSAQSSARTHSSTLVIMVRTSRHKSTAFLRTIATVCLLSVAATAADDSLYFPTISTPNCTVREPIYNHTFDLSALHAPITHKVTGFDKDFVELNVCGTNVKPCAGKTGVTACHTAPGGKQTLIGIDFALKLRDGQLQFEMNGDPCNGTADYATRVQLVCSYAAESRRPIELVSVVGCSYNFVWYTAAACMPLPDEVATNAATACQVHDATSGHTFDLTALASRRNHVVVGRQNETFLLNVCKPVPYQYGGMCPIGSSSCMKQDNATTLQGKFVNIGRTVATPIYEKGVLFMHMPSDVVCNATHNISTHVTFGCDSSTLLGKPEFLNRHGCEYNFDWQTSLACITTTPCAVVDPSTQFTFDLSSLANTAYNVTKGALTYRFGICNAAGAPCADGVGLCRINGTLQQAAVVPLGEFNANMRFNQSGAPFLVYGGGAVCGDIKRQWSSRVEFVCALEGMREGPVVVEEANDGCTVIIQFVTKLVCQEQIACKANDWAADVEYDLGPLRSLTRNYVATVDKAMASQVGRDQVFYLNVCKPLVPQYGLSCVGGSAACMATNSSTNPINERSLGHADVSMTVVDTSRGRRPQLRYLRGSPCPKDPNTDLSAIIEFYCDRTARRGNPILREVHDDCHYRFEWATNVICAEHAVEYRAPGCQLANNDTGAVFDLKTISNDGNMTIKHSPHDFDVNVCSSSDDKSRSVLVNYAENSAKMFFYAAGPCAQNENGKIAVELRIVCRANEHHSALSDTDECTLVLFVETPLICDFLGVELDSKTVGHPVDVPAAAAVAPAEQQSSSIGTVLTVILVIGSVFAVVGLLLHRYPERRTQLTSWILRRDPASVQYSRVQMEPEASILLPQNGRLSDSDDELII